MEADDKVNTTPNSSDAQTHDHLDYSTLYPSEMNNGVHSVTNNSLNANTSLDPEDLDNHSGDADILDEDISSYSKNTHTHGPDCDHDHDHNHNHNHTHTDTDNDNNKSSYDPVDPDRDNILPGGFSEDDKKNLEMLKKMTPQELNNMMMRMMSQNNENMMDPVERRKMLRAKLNQKIKQEDFRRSSKTVRQVQIDKYEKEKELAEEIKKKQASLDTALNSTNNLDTFTKDVEIDDLDKDMEYLPKIDSVVGENTNNEEKNSETDNSVSGQTQKGPQKASVRGGKRRKGKKSARKGKK